LLISFNSSALFSSEEAGLELEINKTISDEGLVGIVWSTVSNDVASVGSAGFSDTSKRTLMSHSHKVNVGSVTKTVLAAGVMRLITQGEITPETNVEKLLPQLGFNNPWRDTAPITVETLLEHTAGLDNIRMWQFLNTAPEPDTPLENAFPSQANELLKVRSKPGTQYSYSNMGYALLAMVIETITGERYEDYLEEQLLAPLGMQDSTFHFVSQTGKYKDEMLAMGYFENNVPQTSVPIYLRPAGQFSTTALDMAKFMLFLLGNGQLYGKPFIRPELMNMIGVPNNTDAKNKGLEIGHGLALAARDRHGVVGFCHPGTTFGFRAYICLFPEDKKAFFYAINADVETSNYEKFNEILINHLALKNADPVKAERQVANLSKVEGIYVPSPNNMAEFEWLDMMFNFKWLVAKNNKVIIKSLQNDDRELLPLNSNLFRASDRTQVSHVIFIQDHSTLLSDGLQTYKKESIAMMLVYWCSLILGCLGLIYILLVGVFRSITRRTVGLKAILWPFLNILAFSIPVYLYGNQSFLKFGELTSASSALAVLSGLLPVTLLLSVFLALKNKAKSNQTRRDIVALLALTQCCLVLASRDVIPIVFWT